MSEPNAMREIHEIREQLYEETKNMAPAEEIARVNKHTRELSDKYGFEFEIVAPPVLVSSKPAKAMKG